MVFNFQCNTVQLVVTLPLVLTISMYICAYFIRWTAHSLWRRKAFRLATEKCPPNRNEGEARALISFTLADSCRTNHMPLTTSPVFLTILTWLHLSSFIQPSATCTMLTWWLPWAEHHMEVFFVDLWNQRLLFKCLYTLSYMFLYIHILKLAN